MSLFQHLIPADDAVFYSKDDPHDVRLGQVALRDKQDYARCNWVLVGCPQDEGIARNQGRAGARKAPHEIRKALYRYPVSEELQHIRLLDAGDINIAGTLEETHERLEATLKPMLADGKKVLVLGGGNDISYPDGRAAASRANKLLAFNIDRHLDVRATEPRNSGTPYRQLLDEGSFDPALFHEVAINSFANPKAYIDFVESIGAHIHYLGDLRDNGVGKAIQSIVDSSEADGIFFGFDMDSVRAVEAPGVSAPGPMGLTAREICEIADVAGSDPRTLLIEISEVNPDYDLDGITSKLAANILVRAMAASG